MVRRLTSASAHACLIEMVFRSAVIASIVVRVTRTSRPATADRRARAPLNTLNKAYRYRVTEATATAHGRPSHEFASMYTRRVDEPLAVAVDCYAGSQGDEEERQPAPVRA